MPAAPRQAALPAAIYRPSLVAITRPIPESELMRHMVLDVGWNAAALSAFFRQLDASTAAAGGVKEAGPKPPSAVVSESVDIRCAVVAARTCGFLGGGRWTGHEDGS